MINPNVAQFKEDVRIPDKYRVIFYPVVGEPILYEVASHRLMESVTEYIKEEGMTKDGKQVYRLVPIKFESMRTWELILTNRKTIQIPFEQGRLEFSEDWDNIVTIKHQIEKEEQEKLGVI